MNKASNPSNSSIQGLSPAQRACCIRSGELPYQYMDGAPTKVPFFFRGDPGSPGQGCTQRHCFCCTEYSVLLFCFSRQCTTVWCSNGHAQAVEVATMTWLDSYEYRAWPKSNY